MIDEVPDAEELIKKVMSEKWDVVVSDLSMPGRSALMPCNRSNLVSLIFRYSSQYSSRRAIRPAALNPGLRVSSKDTAPDELVKAVKKKCCWAKYISQSIAEKLADSSLTNTNKTTTETLSDGNSM